MIIGSKEVVIQQLQAQNTQQAQMIEVLRAELAKAKGEEQPEPMNRAQRKRAEVSPNGKVHEGHGVPQTE